MQNNLQQNEVKEMAVYINILNGGNITIGSGGASGHPETIFTFSGG